MKKYLLLFLLICTSFTLSSCGNKTYTYTDNSGNKFMISNTKYDDVSILGSSYYEFSGKFKNCTKNSYEYVDIIVNFKNDRGEILFTLLDENVERFDNVKPNEEMTFSVKVVKTNEIKKGNETYEFNFKKVLVGDNVGSYVTSSGISKSLIFVNDKKLEVVENKINSIIGSKIEYNPTAILMTVLCEDGSDIEVVAYVSNDSKWVSAEWYDNDEYYHAIGEYNPDSTSDKEDFLNEINRKIITNHKF